MPLELESSHILDIEEIDPKGNKTISYYSNDDKIPYKVIQQNRKREQIAEFHFDSQGYELDKQDNRTGNRYPDVLRGQQASEQASSQPTSTLQSNAVDITPQESQTQANASHSLAHESR